MIFGSGNPIILAADNSFNIELKYTGIIPTFRDKTQIENISPINGYRSWIDLWDHVEFKLMVYLFKYSDPSDAFETIQQIEDKDFYFTPHKYDVNGNLAQYLKDNDGNLLKFHCTKFNPYYLNDYNKFDVIEIEFKSYSPATIMPVSHIDNGYGEGVYGSGFYGQ